MLVSVCWQVSLCMVCEMVKTLNKWYFSMSLQLCVLPYYLSQKNEFSGSTIFCQTSYLGQIRCEDYPQGMQYAWA